MAAVVAIVGRPNVGKSTLFNRLTRSRRALVDDLPGVTRDRLYGSAELEGRRVTLVDTGGFDPPADQAFASEVHAQVELALAEADLILFLTDGRVGVSPLDHQVAERLRRTAKPVILAVNKVDGPELEAAAAEFHALGLEPVHFISAAHGHGVRGLVEALAAALPPEAEAEAEAGDQAVRLALIGRPNVGKSSLVNALVGGPRVVVSRVPGTTRDAVDTPLSAGGRDYLLIDTAGIRRLGRVKRGLEKAAVFRSLRAVERAQVVALVMDAAEGVTDQDLNLAGQAVEAHRGLILVLNKWDRLADQPRRREQVLAQVERAQRFAPWAPVLTTSALTGRGVAGLLPAAAEIHDQMGRRVETGPLNRALRELVEAHQPAVRRGRRLKLYYATQVGVHPPTVVVFANDPGQVHFSYRRYLVNGLRRFMGLSRSPLRLVLRPRGRRR